MWGMPGVRSAGRYWTISLGLCMLTGTLSCGDGFVGLTSPSPVVEASPSRVDRTRLRPRSDKPRPRQALGER